MLMRQVWFDGTFNLTFGFSNLIWDLLPYYKYLYLYKYVRGGKLSLN